LLLALSWRNRFEQGIRRVIFRVPFCLGAVGDAFTRESTSIGLTPSAMSSSIFLASPVGSTSWNYTEDFQNRNPPGHRPVTTFRSFSARLAPAMMSPISDNKGQNRGYKWASISLRWRSGASAGLALQLSKNAQKDLPLMGNFVASLRFLQLRIKLRWLAPG
jgi:hypothetical protein